ncbi:alternative ribosome rescue aminoacyl-tRNA hydrolase ArfB [Polaribacter sp. HL-MS24]|uniref:alternative ribosome rescue aminoacyl-tRNA hydrolase ArfB n=1 Tax=Polaribacter sp. HL-MS24 TaxID=3077735 RepID=UPI002934D296|nr:alternative ribosome rescue aminoacyl-tRNA hydrolase ArfB [Polaribacter sp. HL-MS24]WOC39454.1 alternative ribosome rescue aminoacyl-tRNA hydrolase ArfB [Polaribacter sp. HL-MS24]
MNAETILKELLFKASRSSGAGGQHVNKVSSRIELQFHIATSTSLSEEEKQLLLEKLVSKITKENVLIIVCEETRSQHRNKEIAIQKFLKVIRTGLSRPKKRRPTKPSKATLRKRVENKKKTSVKKVLRKKPKLE